MASDPVQIELTHDEAFVLVAWLHRFDKTGNASFEDQAEQRAIWNLEAVLEKAVDEILDPRYDQLLADARARLRDQVD